MLQVPCIVENPFGGWSCITKYKVLGGGVIEIKQQFDVTQQINKIVKTINARKRKRGKTCE